MDPVSVVSLVATITQLIDTTSKVIRYLNEAKNAPQERAELAREVTNLLPLLTDLRYRTEDVSSTDPWFAGLQSLGGKGGPLEAFKDALEDMAAKLKPPKNSIHKLGQSLSWTLERKEVDKLLARVERLKTLVGLALQKDSFKLSQAIKDEVTAGFKGINLERDAAKVANWLSAPDVSLNHNAAVKKRQPSTGDWFIKGKDFTHWKTETNSFFWLHGIPGCGKTVLCSTIVEHILSESQSESKIATAYFYFDFNDSSKQHVSSLLRSLLAQLSARNPSLQLLLHKAYASSQSGQLQPTTEAMIDILSQMLATFEHVYLFFDALDECVELEELCTAILKISTWKLDAVHVLATSRKERELQDTLHSLATYQVSIQSALVEADIRLHVSERLLNDQKLKKWQEEDKREIEKKLVAGANGMFRWVVCQLDSLRKCLKRSELRKTLARLPKTLDQTYERILSEIDEDFTEDASRVLQWLCYSERPMRLDAMVDVLATNLSNEPAFDPDERLSDPWQVVTICSSLINISEELTQLGKVEYLRLAHFSVKEYLLSERIQQPSFLRYAVNGLSANIAIVKTCLAYMDYFQDSGSMTKDLLLKFPLYDYAAEHWTVYYHLIDREAQNYVDHLIIGFLESKNSSFMKWTELRSSNIDTDPESNPAGPLYYLSLIGASALISVLFKRNTDQIIKDEDQTIKDEKADSKLASHGHASYRVPLYKDKIKSSGGKYGNPLQAASSNGHLSTVKLLLDSGANVNAQGGFFGNALQAAAQSSSYEVVVLLLERGADVNAQGGLYGNALQAATCKSNKQVIYLLFDRGANVNARGGKYNSALEAASQESNLGIVRLLLARGADVGDSRWNEWLRYGHYPWTPS